MTDVWMAPLAFFSCFSVLCKTDRFHVALRFVEDHRGRQNKEHQWHIRLSPRVQLTTFLPHFICDFIFYYWTDARQHEIYRGNVPCIRKPFVKETKRKTCRGCDYFRNLLSTDVLERRMWTVEIDVSPLWHVLSTAKIRKPQFTCNVLTPLSWKRQVVNTKNLQFTSGAWKLGKRKNLNSRLSSVIQKLCLLTFWKPGYATLVTEHIYFGYVMLYFFVLFSIWCNLCKYC